MTTTSEVLWADLLLRPHHFFPLDPDADYVEFGYLLGTTFTPVFNMINVDLFTFSTFEIGVSDRSAPIPLYLRFFIRSTDLSVRVDKLLPVRWPSFIRSDLSGLHKVFRYDASKVVILYTSDSPDDTSVTEALFIPPPGSRPLKPLPLRRLRRTRILTPRILANHLGNDIRASRPSLKASLPPLSRDRNPDLTVVSSMTTSHEQTGVNISFSTYEYVSRSRVTVRSKTPNFRKIKKSDRPVNPYSLTSYSLDMSPGYYSRDLSPSGSSQFFVDVIPTFPSLWDGVHPQGLSASFDAGTYEQSVKRAIGKAPSNLSINLAQDFGQWKQTTDLIKANLDRIRFANAATASGQFKRAQDLLFNRTDPRSRKAPRGEPRAHYDLASNWLEFQYGWKILLMEIREAVELAASYYTGSNFRTVVRSSAFREQSTSNPILSTNAELAHPYYTGVLTSVKKNKCSVGIRYQVNSSFVSFIAQLGFTNPINLVYEVIPYSFVLDWVLPIGPYLESLSAFHGYTFVDGWVTQSCDLRTTADVNFDGLVGAGSGVERRIETGGLTEKYFLLRRDKLLNFPSVGLSFKSPISTTHALNALALLKVAFSR